MRTAADGAVAHALRESLHEVARLAAPLEGEPASLTRLPPLDGVADRYGDVAPLGPALLALRRGARALRSPELGEAARRLRAYLLGKRSGGLWPYHSGSLVTSIDSALVLLGVRDRRAVDRLEAFRVGDGYLPQLCTRGRERGKMTVSDRVLHWCQPDYSIACLVAHLRRRAGRDPSTPVACFARGFDGRAGLYLADPYLVDWLTALGLAALPGTEPLRERLKEELLASAREDGGFGTFDPLASTALALLALQALGAPAAPRRLAELWEARAGAAPSRPFYSTERFSWSRLPPWSLLAAKLDPAQSERLVRVGEEEHVITFYEDGEGLWRATVTALALLASRRGSAPARAPASTVPHARYRCATRGAYIEAHALPPYVRSEEEYLVPR